MKLLLFTVHFLFVSHSYAQELVAEVDVAHHEKTVCADGSPAKTVAHGSVRSYTLTADLKTLTISSEDNGEISSESFTLTAYGKDTYMAVTTSETSNTREFFVKTNADLSSLEVYARDNGGALCGGGMVVTQIKEFTLTTDFQESKGG